ncbi:aconitate hydratase [Ectothiorhodospira magna]|uniref:Aconitate hydratase n=1 Tax=Ectothiorhodospira magna TaxID=867345 RepID=A0A1H9AUT8_9GAMM|nr:aconitate hydratase AcnA [Ectothiorhodospira magna]SEP80389.1 aconitate hydratase [Ectothiorhodospira magna]
MSNSFNTEDILEVQGRTYHIHSLVPLRKNHDLDRLPFSLKILLENLLRCEDGRNITQAQIQAILDWNPKAEPRVEIGFTPARVVLQDFTGVPAVVDLAAMRDAMVALGQDPGRINPLTPVDLVVDHSVMVDHFGQNNALDLNIKLEYQRNKERYQFLRWGQQAFENFRVVPPGTGIVHQVNLEYLAHTVFVRHDGDTRYAYPDTLVGTDSHTTMINGLGVLGWGVGGIEAEAAMLGQPISMLIPQVVGFHLKGQLPEGATATDLVLTVTQKLRSHGVVGKFVEFFGDGLNHLPLADRATIANMAPEYGATCGIFPIDQDTLAYLRLSGRAETQVALVEAYARHQGLWRDGHTPQAEYSDILELDLSTVVPSLAGPRRPQDRIPLNQARRSFDETLSQFLKEQQAKGTAGTSTTDQEKAIEYEMDGLRHQLQQGAVVIAAITSCTHTSNPAVLLAAGLLAKKARDRGLKPKPWVKTSLAPGSQVVPAYLQRAGLLEPLEALGFNVVGFGCTTCIGNAGPLPEPIGQAISKGNLMVAAVLSGNRNFEGRIHGQVRANYLASPPLVVAYALAGTMAVDLYHDPLGTDAQGQPVFLKDIWPSQEEINRQMATCIDSAMFQEKYADVFKGDAHWQRIEVTGSQRYDWVDSTYVKNPPYFKGMTLEPKPLPPIDQARCLVMVGDSITTDHISPAGNIPADSPAGQYLQAHGIEPQAFNSYGSRRGNHEVMMRGTFANVRLRNLLAPGTEGGWTLYWPDGEMMSIYDAAMRYQETDTPLLVLAGQEYGTGSSRDWAAKGTRLLGVRTVIAESFERIHRSNLVGFGVLPLQFMPGENAGTLGLSGRERYCIGSLDGDPDEVTVTVIADEGTHRTFQAKVRIDTPNEWAYYRHGGILHYMIRQLAI